MDDKGEWTRQAIDVMAVWSDPHDDGLLLAGKVAAYAGAGPEDAMKLTVGFVNLAAILLLELERTSGADRHEILRDAVKVTL